MLKATGNPQEKIEPNQKFDKILSITGSSHNQGLEMIPEVGCEKRQMSCIDLTEASTPALSRKHSMKTQGSSVPAKRRIIDNVKFGKASSPTQRGWHYYHS